MDFKLKQKEYQRKCFEIIESVLTEENIDSNAFLKHCLYITRSHYNDMTTERSLIDLCGYVLCPNRLSLHNKSFKAKQKFKIDSKNNKVYEIEERKQFCSNLCFKSSNYLRQQISEEPIYMRTDSDINAIHLYTESVGNLGKEVVFDENLINDCLDQKSVMKLDDKQTMIGYPYIKEDFLDQLKDQMKGLVISEKNTENCD